jgi:predicted Zn-dependent peptidase
MHRLLRAAVLALAVTLARGASARADGGDALAAFKQCDHFTLGNGLQVVLRSDHRAPFVALTIWYATGSRDDPPGRSGLAHLVEHLMFEGSRHVPGGHKRWVHKLQLLSANAETDLDRTRYFETFYSANLEAALWLESDRMGFPDPLDEAALARARAAVRHERGEKIDDRAYAAALLRFHRALFPAPHPYGQDGQGDDRALDAIRLEDVRAFRARWYVPANATLSMVGDFDPDQARVLVQKYFAPLPSPPRPAPPAVEAPALERELVLREPERFGSLTNLWIGWRTPGFFVPGDATADVVAHLLTGGRSSRLGRRLDQEQRLTVSTQAHQASYLGVSAFTIRLTLNPGVDPQRTLAAVDDELADLAEHGPSRDELAAALAYLELRLVTGLEGVGGLERTAEKLALYQYALGDPSGILRDRDRYRAVQAEDVRRFVREQLDPQRRVVLIAEPIAGTSAPRPAPPLDDVEDDR